MISTWGVKWGVPLFSETSTWTHVQFTTQFTTLQCFHRKINNMYYTPKFWMVLLFMMAPYHLKNGTTFLDLFGVFPTSHGLHKSANWPVFPRRFASPVHCAHPKPGGASPRRTKGFEVWWFVKQKSWENKSWPKWETGRHGDEIWKKMN